MRRVAAQGTGLHSSLLCSLKESLETKIPQFQQGPASSCLGCFSGLDISIFLHVAKFSAIDAAESFGESLVLWHLPLKGGVTRAITRSILLSLKLQGCMCRLVLTVPAAHYAVTMGSGRLECKADAVFIFII